MNPKIKISFIILSLFIILTSCGDKSEGNQVHKGKNSISAIAKPATAVSEYKIKKVVFFIENSGSMLGYVKKPNDYKNAIVSLSYFPEFDNSQKEFYFINGKNNPQKKSKISSNSIGSDPEILKNNLNQNSFNNNGDPRYSDLTLMFEQALNCAKEGTISILVSDCIYDVGEESDPLTALRIETEKTKKVFRDRIATNNIQTIIIKAESQFEGKYYFASRNGSQNLNQKRPYYILIFGDSKLLNKHFNEEDISKTITGYVSMTRFMKVDNTEIPYQATDQNSKGKFRFDKKNKNKLIKVEKDRNNQGFQFSIAVDYSSLPFPDTYYREKENYTITGTYKIIDIKIPDKKIHAVTSFTPSHLITIHTDSSPYGKIILILKYIIPNWIDETNADNELNIIGDSSHTFGFKYLTNAITEAYQYKTKEQNISKYEIEILK